MLGISISVAVEKLTNRGTLQQMGIPTPSIVVLALLLVAFLGASAYGAFKTERKFNSGRMSDKEMRRYRRVLLLEGEEEEIRSGIAESKVKGTAVDRMLAPLTKEAYSTDSDNAEERSTVRQAVKPKEVPASVQDVQAAFSDDYLREIGVVVRQKGPLEVVEDIGGRLAMVGFLAAILVEAGSGRGILRQGMFWAKILGLAPPDVMDLAYYDDTMSYFQ